jgi:hypothetical protein
MKLVTYRTDAHGRAGILLDDTILDLSSCLAWYEHREGRPCRDADVDHKYGHGVPGFVENAAIARPAADAILIAFTTDTLPKSFDARILAMHASGKHLLAPIPCPRSLREKQRFINHQAVVGPGDVMVEKRQAEKLHFDLEAAIVIGKEVRNLNAEHATDAIFGMTIMTHFGARALEADCATALGPWLVTSDELAHHDLAMTARVNGQEVVKAKLGDPSSPTFGHILAHASYGVTLYPGDVIGSGPRGGNHDRLLRPDDVVELEIDGLGVLRNRVVLAG